MPGSHVVRRVLMTGIVTFVGMAVLLGCQATLMPTLVAFADTDVDPHATMPDEKRTTPARVFYATNRIPRSDPANPAMTCTNARNHGLRLGVAHVDLAPNMDWPQLHDTSRQTRRSSNPSPRLTGVEEIGSLWRQTPWLDAAAAEDPEVAQRFAADVLSALDEDGVDEIFIFVHGFNTRYADNCVLAAELHHFFGRPGVMMSYAWPSQVSLFAYGADKASAQYSIRYVRLLLAYLAANTDVGQINLIAHSAGAPVAVEAIRELCLMHHDEGTEAVQARYRIGQLILVAPDMDSGIFANATHDEIAGVPTKMAIYFSTLDKALDISAWIFGFARLGEPLTVLGERELRFLHDHPDVELINVAGAEKHHGSWLGHVYFHDDPWGSSDLVLLARQDAAPAARGLIQMEESPIWIFPRDYLERVRAVAERMWGTSPLGETIERPAGVTIGRSARSGLPIGIAQAA